MHPRIVHWLTHTRPFLLNSTSRAHYYFAIKANKSSSLFVSTWQSAEGLRVSPQCDLTLTPVWPLFPQLHPGLDPLPLGSNKWELGSGEAEVGVHNGGSRGRRQTSNLKCLLNFFFLNLFLLLSLLGWKCGFSDIWSAACAVFFTVTHITYAALVFKVNSLNVLFNRFITLYSLICTLFIWFPSSFSRPPLIIQQFLARSHFLSSVPPFIPPLLTLFFCPALYFGLRSHLLLSPCLLLVNSNFLLTHMEIFVHRSRMFDSSPYFTSSNSSVLLPVSLVSVVSFPPSCHPLCLLPPSLYPSLLSSSPSILLSSVQLHSNPGRQQDLELTGEMRWWNGMTSVVRMCACICSTNLSSGSH